MKQLGFLTLLIIYLITFYLCFGIAETKKLNKINKTISSYAEKKMEMNKNHSESKDLYDANSHTDFNGAYFTTKYLTPKYVEKLKYYNDSPATNEVEPVIKDTGYGTYYMPFSNPSLKHKITHVYNCDLIVSAFDCRSSSLCKWNEKSNACALNRYTYNFRQMINNLRNPE